MQIGQIIRNINTQLAGELLSVGELKDFVDKAIDDINTRLNTCFPVLSDVMIQKVVDEDGNETDEFVSDYTAIPDKYIRSVVIPGAVFKYYTTDEEGSAVAPKYEEEFIKGLFYMERDYIDLVPPQYLETMRQGWVKDPFFARNPFAPYPLLRHRKEGEFTIDGNVFQL